LKAQDKANVGLWLIEVAILQLIREKGPLHPSEVEDELHLRWISSQSGKPEGICYIIMRRMTENGLLVTDGGYHPKYSIKPGSTH
jgi:hypothetical protein